MYCTNCGRESEESIKFCVYCGTVLDEGDTGSGTGGREGSGRMASQAAAVSMAETEHAAAGRRITFILAVILNAFVITMGFMRWIRIRIRFIGFDERYHLWEAVQLVEDIADLTGKRELDFFALFLAIPLILWLIGILLTMVGILSWVINQARRKAWKWFIGASIVQMMSALLFLITAYGMRFLINNTVAWKLESTIGWRPDSVTIGDSIRVSLWPWIVLGLSIFMLIMFSASRDPEKPSGYKGTAAAAMSMPPVASAVSSAMSSMNAMVSKTASATDWNDENTMMPDWDDDCTILLDSEGNGQRIPEFFHVVLQDRKMDSQVYTCNVMESLVIGRDAREADVVIEGNKSISRKHCRLFRDGDTCFVEDLDSANHTYLNGEMLTLPMPLQEGDVLKLGMVECVVTECSL